MSMKKLLNFVQGGSTKLPPGLKFQPTDEEIVFEYLFRKTFSYPLPSSVVPEISICRYDPWDMPGDAKQDMYFFSKKEPKYANSNRINRKTQFGYWKASGSDKKITGPRKRDTINIMGMRKTLVFHTGKSPNGSRTEWIMHEYRLVNSESNASSENGQSNNSTKNTLVQVGDWVLCHMFMKNGSRDDKAYDLMRVDLNDSASSSSSSSCGSSSFTEVTSTKTNR